MIGSRQERFQETLCRIGQNDATLTCLQLSDHFFGSANAEGGEFTSNDGNDFSQLGGAIRENKHLKSLDVRLGGSGLDVTNRGFFDGLKHNTSISDLKINFSQHYLSADIDPAGQVGQEILRVYQENSSNLTRINIYCAYLLNGGDIFIATSLRNCTHLRSIRLAYNSISDEQLLPIIEAVRGHHSLEVLNLNGNSIGNAGCEALSTLLRDPNCNLRILSLANNSFIDNEGATILANSLDNNAKLEYLHLYNDTIDQNVQNVFLRLLCNTSTINNTYISNHTLETLSLPHQTEGEQLDSLLNLNEEMNKSHVAIKKILKYHPNIDMEPFFEWNMEGDERERNLKALPYIIDWFERAGHAVAEDRESYDLDTTKLSAIYQFAHAMPLLFVPALHHTKGENNKRKRE